MSDTVGLIFVPESSPRYPEFVNLKENLISMGVRHDPQTLAQFIFYLNISCTPHSKLDQAAFLSTLIDAWNEHKKLSVLTVYENFYVNMNDKSTTSQN